MMPARLQDMDRGQLEEMYEKAARRYYRSLPAEETIDTFRQGTERQILLASFDLIQAARPDVQCFNELLIRYPRPGGGQNGRVVPNNFVVVHPEPIKADDSFDTESQPANPFLVLEYVTEYQPKDYQDHFVRYERELRVPYYLRIHPEDETVALFELRDGHYHPTVPNAAGRLAIPELELEVALHEGWVRFWFRGELLPLPGDLLRQLKAARAQLESARVQLTVAEQELTATSGKLTVAEQELMAAKDRLSVAQAKLNAEADAKAEAQRRADAAEAELARLRADLAKRSGGQ